MESSLPGKYRELQKLFSQHKKVAIAFSGGVDSTFLLHAACATLGPSLVHAFHATSELLPYLETERVERVIQEQGCVFHPIPIKPLTWPDFVANGDDRCYHCKKKIYQTFLVDPSFPVASALFDGTNHDDLDQDRPGLQAVVELSVQTPLADLGFSKKEIRLLSRELSLSTWDAPASSCLATRISQGEPLSREKILLVAQCEAVLQRKGFMGVRVRLSGDTATIFVLKKDLPGIEDKCVYSGIKRDFLSLGLHKVSINQQGRPD
ncbi:ATP-dependent sacrificial sulfur transferase LarE [Thiovibrio frasassiensis]|uniref:ATP-dependent sacrificial sulfur transferase LarE n=1 Tax=Thiovibrio frasassiensis TaxID=2984131 RepID=A0A9X4RLY7_9BACT|nr:ATP-dependent sacrificial sulfur transferase LarE [Thiovibrio frasassiensis]MDG4476556.1 ATP-dependent sacrificial sulfur transferase LarE [Thiovibrio frasassiensis]